MSDYVFHWLATINFMSLSEKYNSRRLCGRCLCWSHGFYEVMLLSQELCDRIFEHIFHERSLVHIVPFEANNQILSNLYPRVSGMGGLQCHQSIMWLQIALESIAKYLYIMKGKMS